MDSNQKSAQPLVSVMLLVKNGEPHISEQIDSILAQTYKNLELIICDDFSTDRTPEIAQEYMRKDPRVKWVRNESNVKVSMTFQIQSHECRGELIAPSDADDVWLPEKIEKQVAYLTKHPEVDMVFADDLIVNSDLSKKMGSFQRKMGNDSPGGLIAVDTLLERNFVAFHISCFRRKMLEKLLPMPEQSAFMYDAWAALVCSLDHPIGYINECLVLYRQHQSNMVGSSTRDNAFYLKRLNDPEFLQYYLKDKSQQMTVHKRLLRLGGSGSAREALTQKIEIQTALLEAMRAPNFFEFLLRLFSASWTILKSSQKYHFKQWAFLLFSWGGIRKLKLSHNAA